MFIKEIVLDGFKCYEEKVTVANLDRSFNAITGMNGSGKSNVLDGILFALGLESTKALRANNTRELVNANRKECKVSLVLCNEEKSKSPPGYEHYDEICISRSIDAEGRTKCYINSHLCTSSALSKLCTSMGLGPRGSFSSIVMQGHITKVLSMKSSDLRELIEETAGTRSYEREKERAIAMIEKKEERLKDVREMLQRRISPFYDRLRQERTRFLETRDIHERRKELERREQEIKGMLVRHEIGEEIDTLEKCLRSYAGEMKTLGAIEKRIEEISGAKEEVDVVWIKAAIDGEKLRLDELKGKNLEEELVEKREEMKRMKDLTPSVELDELVERERLLVESLRRIDSGENDVLKKIEEVTSLKFERSRAEFELSSISGGRFSQERLDEIERLKVSEDEIEEMRRKAHILRSKINYPFVEGVFGTVEENVEVCDKKYLEAVYTVMGSRGKYVIASDEKVGGFLVSTMERSVSVIPLSKIRVFYLSSSVTREIESKGGVNMVSLLKFNSDVRKAIEFVFNNFFVFESKEMARKVCFEQKVMCVTVDGTVYDPKGTLSGGKTNFRVGTVRRKDVEDIERTIGLLEENRRKFESMREEYGELLRGKALHERREELKEKIRSFDTRISILSNLCENGMNIKEELRAVREKMVEGMKEKNEIDGAIERRKRLECKIKELECAIRSNKEEIRMCEEKILSYERMLGKHNMENDSRRMSEKEIDGLESNHRHLIRSTGKLQNRITKIYNDVERKLSEASEHGVEQRYGNVGMLDEEIRMAAESAGISPRCLLIRRKCISEEEKAGLTKELEMITGEMERLRCMRRSTMDPANFDLLERNELMIEELKEKIDKLEKDRLAIGQSISRFDDLGYKENLKAFKHINGRLGRFLRYFIPGSDARIDERNGEYSLKVKVGNWKESLNELSGGQRSLVALCLIFSMLTYRPSSFYIFDEIDSALDLSYTQGIGEIIKKEFDSAQFIVVSLKSGMFDNANNIFKVYLQDGKSRICRIK
ncbi:chromosome segregation ATPase [Encephalitozoon hellem ATCC 50504]|uniref:Structural maintenance of chromosomes protein 2 n=1 Tax=Encephalitozoon hellem TaxID=27973 RepID=A0A9Q9C1M1_ENCHE|nr:chromosome segregation ATPase [Encephalitozoon hellem ATCC 50504]AFM97729.1 chromosome segregation ATPase [Encephalitozoon hellem ATCC 50504]UTX42421.1 Structural maintenance of chromosomes protein 2 [Encephalitozoon hellem]|eukprot:XP_003886710.1 chromosome segregation ATPase [Encephalitozoon hellem ATCC 50504]